MREIRIAGQGGGARIGAPMQTESLAYFSRMVPPPSAAFREAVNWAIWRWKAIGTWSLIKGMWILSADHAQAALLSVNGDTPRDAVIIGTSPTFTPLKGYSGFDVGKQVKFPITAAILASDSVFGFGAFKVVPIQDFTDPENPVWIKGDFIHSDAGIGTTAGTPGHFAYNTNGLTNYRIIGVNTLLILGEGASGAVVAGNKGTTTITAGTLGGGNSSPGARSSNYITRAAPTALNRLCAYGFLDASATTLQSRQHLTILYAMLDMIGAMD